MAKKHSIEDLGNRLYRVGFTVKLNETGTDSNDPSYNVTTKIDLGSEKQADIDEIALKQLIVKIQNKGTRDLLEYQLNALADKVWTLKEIFEASRTIKLREPTDEEMETNSLKRAERDPAFLERLLKHLKHAVDICECLWQSLQV